MYHKEPEVPQYQKQFLDNVKQLGSQIRSVSFQIKVLKRNCLWLFSG